MSVAVSAAIYNNMRSTAFSFVKTAGKKILILLNRLMTHRTGSFYAGLASRVAVRTAVNVAYLVINLTVCRKYF